MAKPNYAVVLRAYGSREERARVKAGEIFTIDAAKAEGNMLNISFARFRQLSDARLVKEWKKGDPIPGPRDARPPMNKMEPDSIPQPVTGAMIREATRRRARGEESQMIGNVESPPEPKALRGPSGGRIGGEKSPSSLQVGLAQAASILKPRGTRRESSSSPLTTRGSSAHGQEPSTPVTPIGGDSDSRTSEAPSEDVL